jgi:hypothetical protein
MVLSFKTASKKRDLKSWRIKRMRRNHLLIAVVVAFVAGIFVSGCLTSNNEDNTKQTETNNGAAVKEEEKRYTEEVGTDAGTAVINATLPVKSISANDPLPFRKMAYQTWYGIDISTELPGSYSISTVIVDPTDLEKVDLRIELVNGGVPHVRNLRVSHVEGKYRLEGDYAGIIGIGVWDGTDANDPRVYADLNKPIVLPDFVGKQDFLFIVYANTSYTGA